MAKPHIEPMLATAVSLENLPRDSDWITEPKLNGWRMLADAESNGSWSLYSRRNADYTAKFPWITEQLALSLNGLKAVLDGELVAFDENHHERRELLYQPTAQNTAYFPFDILSLNGVSAISWPWSARHEMLQAVLHSQPNIIPVTAFEHTDLAGLLEAVGQLGVEGVVSKRRSALYQPGKRSHDWRKYRIATPATNHRRKPQ
jgi:bifunctional non-homologous end joining protein LigD